MVRHENFGGIPFELLKSNVTKCIFITKRKVFEKHCRES